MKNTILSFILLLISVFAYAQKNSRVVGEWYSPKDNLIINIFELNQTISAKITWMRLPNDENGKPKTDLLNPDQSLKAIEIVGLIMMSNFTHIAGDVWDNGTLYIPEKGKSYSGMMRLKDENTLNIRGYIGFSFFERYSSNWTRVLETDQFRNLNLGKGNVLTYLKKDLNRIIKLVEDISLKPAEEIIRKIEKEDLLIQLQQDLNKIIKKIEKIKKTE